MDETDKHVTKDTEDAGHTGHTDHTVHHRQGQPANA